MTHGDVRRQIFSEPQSIWLAQKIGFDQRFHKVYIKPSYTESIWNKLMKERLNAIKSKISRK